MPKEPRVPSIPTIVERLLTTPNTLTPGPEMVHQGHKLAASRYRPMVIRLTLSKLLGLMIFEDLAQG